MEINCHISNIGPMREGCSSRGPWKLIDFIATESGAEYPQSLVLTARGSVAERIECLKQALPQGASQVEGEWRLSVRFQTRLVELPSGSKFNKTENYCIKIEKL